MLKVVENAERARESRRDHAQVMAVARSSRTTGWASRERADLVADDRRGLAEERPRLTERGSELARERPQPLRGAGPSSPASANTFVSVVSVCESRWEQA